MTARKRALGFPKAYRLKRRKLFESLMAGGRSAFRFPVKAVYLPVDHLPGDVPFQATVAVSRKKFRKAVRRNRIKRLMREAFRLEQEHLQHSRPVAIMFVYVAREELPLTHLRETMRVILREISQQIDQNGTA